MKNGADTASRAVPGGGVEGGEGRSFRFANISQERDVGFSRG